MVSIIVASPEVEIKKDFLLTLIGIFVMICQYAFLGPFSTGGRRKSYTKEYLELNFGDVHKRYDIPIPVGGYPDYGNGWYSRKLSYKDWFEFNCYLRVHQNTLEYITVAVLAVFVTGIFSPILSAILAGAWFVLRIFYIWRYVCGRTKGVELFSYLSTLVIAVGFGFSLYNIFYHA